MKNLKEMVVGETIQVTSLYFKWKAIKQIPSSENISLIEGGAKRFSPEKVEKIRKKFGFKPNSTTFYFKNDANNYIMLENMKESGRTTGKGDSNAYRMLGNFNREPAIRKERIKDFYSWLLKEIK